MLIKVIGTLNNSSMKENHNPSKTVPGYVMFIYLFIYLLFIKQHL